MTNYDACLEKVIHSAVVQDRFTVAVAVVPGLRGGVCVDEQGEERTRVVDEV